jgi:hypothetical protein
MSKNVSDEVRRILDDPIKRYRLVDAWLLMNRRQELEAKLAEKKASREKSPKSATMSAD